MDPTNSVVAACCALAVLTVLVGIRMLSTRLGEMRSRKIHPQKVSLSAERAQQFEDTRAADNYNHLFELPVLFYAVCAIAIATQNIPVWFPILAWLFVASRYVHSLIQCTYNKVMHRFRVFLIGFLLVLVMWIGFTFSFIVG